MTRGGFILVLAAIACCGLASRAAAQGSAASQLAAAEQRASALHKQGKSREAIPYYEQAVTLSYQVYGREHLHTARNMHNLAMVYTENARLDQAEPFYEACLRIMAKDPNASADELAEALNNVSHYYWYVGQRAKALAYCRQALEIHRARNSAASANMVEHNLGLMLREAEEYDESLRVLEHALAWREKNLPANHSGIWNCRNTLAGAYMMVKRYAEAEALQRACLEHYERVGAPMADQLMNLGMTLEHEGKHEAAAEYYRRGLAESKRLTGGEAPSYFKCLHHVAMNEAYRGHWTEAADAMEQSRHGLRRYLTGMISGLSDAEQNSIVSIYVTGALGLAVSLGVCQPDDRRLVELTAEVVLNAKGSAQEALAERNLLARDSSDPKLTALVEDLRNARKQLATLTYTLPQARDQELHRRRMSEWTEYESSLTRRLRAAGGHGNNEENWVKLEQLRAVIPKDTVLVDIVRCEFYDYRLRGEKPDPPFHYIAWIIPSEGAGDVQLVELGPTESIDTAITKLLGEIQTVAALYGDGALDNDEQRLRERSYREAAEALSRLVVHPLLARSGTTTRWLLSPDGALWLAPWSALTNPAGQYLVLSHTLTHVVTARDFVHPRSAGTSTTAAIFANPDYDLKPTDAKPVLEAMAAKSITRGDSEPKNVGRLFRLDKVERLPGTAKEAAAIQPYVETFTHAPPRVFFSAEAQEAVFKSLVSPRVLVLSTHGLFIADESSKPGSGTLLENPLLRCNLALAGCNDHDLRDPTEEDGILTGLEIVGTDLRATELVLLSACQTGIGDLRSAEGVVGVRQAFQLAGAHAVIASLWSVADRETAELMAAFFESLAAQGDKADALRQAELSVLGALEKQGRPTHPYFWAAFTLTDRP